MKHLNEELAWCFTIKLLTSTFTPLLSNFDNKYFLLYFFFVVVTTRNRRLEPGVPVFTFTRDFLGLLLMRIDD
jgi:hypothetical protein